MTILLWTVLGVALAAVATAIHAVLTAPPGYEDDQGFHAITGVEPGSSMYLLGRYNRNVRFRAVRGGAIPCSGPVRLRLWMR